MSPSLFPDRDPISPHHVSSSRARKHIPHSMRPSDFVVKRNQRERNRVNTVNQAFEQLRTTLRNTMPHQAPKLSKMSILKHAALYIQHLAHALGTGTDSHNPGQHGSLVINTGTCHIESCQRGTRGNTVNCETDIFRPSDRGSETHSCRSSYGDPSQRVEQIQDRTSHESTANEQPRQCANSDIHLGQCSRSFTSLRQPDSSETSRQPAIQVEAPFHPGPVRNCDHGKQDITHIIYQWSTS